MNFNLLEKMILVAMIDRMTRTLHWNRHPVRERMEKRADANKLY
jgi:hypothetical protein